MKAFITDTLNVKWGHLHRPDDKFGADSSNHNVTVIVDKNLQKVLDTLKKESGADKINGMRVDDDGDTLLKVKTKTFVKKGEDIFPCRDAQAEPTTATPFGGDKVRLRLNPMVLDRDNSLSIYLNGCQIIEKNASDTGGFEPTDGFVASDYTAPTPESSNTEATEVEDLPF